VDRRKFQRVDAPVFCRPIGQPLFGRRKAVDVSLGGLRIYADDPPKAGDRMELELFLPDQTELACTVEVVWVDDLPEGSPARIAKAVSPLVARMDAQNIQLPLEIEPATFVAIARQGARR